MTETLNCESSHADLMYYLLEAFKDASFSEEQRKRVEVLMWAAVVLSSVRRSANPAECLKRLGNDLDFHFLLKVASQLEQLTKSNI